MAISTMMIAAVNRYICTLPRNRFFALTTFLFHIASHVEHRGDVSHRRSRKEAWVRAICCEGTEEYYEIIYVFSQYLRAAQNTIFLPGKNFGRQAIF